MKQTIKTELKAHILDLINGLGLYEPFFRVYVIDPGEDNSDDETDNE